jgi:hypothetical protein
MAVESGYTGTTENTFSIGDGADGYKYILANNSDINKPGIRWNDNEDQWESSTDGTTWAQIGSGVGGSSLVYYVAVAGNQSALDGYYAQIGSTYLDPSMHSPSATYTFQVILEATAGADAYIQLYNQTDGYEITDSNLFTSEVVPTFLEVQLIPGVTQYFETTPIIYSVRSYTTVDSSAAICKMARIQVT